jgi:predicted adenylyl cyclase CyaB
VPRNVEIKARAKDFDRQLALAVALADGPPDVLWQEDTFFHTPTGRLKLRMFKDGSGELIAYRRPDVSGPKTSDYTILPLDDVAATRATMTQLLGVLAVVRKARCVLMCGQTRIHFDKVDDLGAFIELEVVLDDDETEDHGAEIARGLMAKLDIDDADLVEGAYVDLLTEKDK